MERMKSLVNYSSSSDSEDDSKAVSGLRGTKRKHGELASRTQNAVTDKETDQGTEVFDPLAIFLVSNNPPVPPARINAVEDRTWLCFLYLPLEASSRVSETLEALARRARELDSRIDLIEEAEASRASGFHVSLTRPVFLRSFQFEAFLRMIRERLRNAKRFTLGLGRISSYPNSDGSRTFLAADVTVGAKQIGSLVKQIDEVVEHFRQPKYYDPPSFHASFAFVAGGRECIQNTVLTQLQAEFGPEISRSWCNIHSVGCVLGSEKVAIEFVKT